MSPVTIYTTGPSCMKCRQTKRALQKAGVPFVERDAEEIRNFATEKGYVTAPVVVTADGHSWCDFRIEEINRLARNLNDTTSAETAEENTRALVNA